MANPEVEQSVILVGTVSVNVAEYGVRGDNATDNTVALQTLLNAIGAGTEKRRNIIFGSGTFLFSATLLPVVGNITIQGAGRQATILTQMTANLPLFAWLNEGGGDKANIVFRHMLITNANLPTVATPQQYGIQFRATPAGTGGLGYGYYLMMFDDVEIRNAYVGIGSYTTGGGICPIWSTTWRDCVFSGIYHGAIDLLQSGNGGQPNNRMDGIDVLNYAIYGVVNDGAWWAITAGSCNGLSMRSVNIEDWQGNGVYILGGGGNEVIGLRAERHVFTAASQHLIQVAETIVLSAIDDTAIIANNGAAYCYTVRVIGAASKVMLNGVAADIASGTGIVTLLWGDVGAQVSVFSALAGGGVAEFATSAWGNGLFCRTIQDGLAPIVDALPPAGVVYRGRRFRVLGATNDVESECSLVASAYAWVTK